MALLADSKLILYRVGLAFVAAGLLADAFGLVAPQGPVYDLVRGLALFGGTRLLFLAIPNRRRTELALALLLAVLWLEVLREVLLGDIDHLRWPLEALGVMVAVTPALIERRRFDRAPVWFDKDNAQAPPKAAEITAKPIDPIR